MADSIIIIGAGVAGLSAGCYGRMNGYRTHIFEMHDKPGGVCTSWTRKGYTFDGCIHWLVGSSPGSGFNKIWRELGALPGPRVVDHDVFVRIEGEGGKALTVYTDEDRLERHMKELAPSDCAAIEDFTGAIRKLKHMQMPADPPKGFGEVVEMLKGLPGLVGALLCLRKLTKETAEEYAQRFNDPFLRDAIVQILGVSDMPATVLPITLAWMSAKDAGYPVGGSLEFSRSIERRYLDLGGEVTYEAPVEQILVEQGKAVGVRLADGTEHRADYVVSAADGHATIFEMLGGNYVGEETLRAYGEWPLWDPLVQVSIGVARDLSAETHAMSVPLDEPLDSGGSSDNRFRWHHYCYDETLAPTGKSCIVAFLASDYDYWKRLREDPKKYKAEKKRVASDVIDLLDARYEGFRAQVEVVDVATPTTTERYTGNWRGSFEGWRITRENSRYVVRNMKRTLPGLDNFYMTGQWLMPGGGLPPAAQLSRAVIKAICKKDGRKFTATE
ncbi:MAG: phytoene desaturase family protein [Candidatus Geothermincolia bacterium]